MNVLRRVLIALAWFFAVTVGWYLLVLGASLFFPLDDSYRRTIAGIPAAAFLLGWPVLWMLLVILAATGSLPGPRRSR